MVRALAEASEARGTDAAGIAYNVGGTLQIHKRPGPAHTIHFTVPKASKVIMGHTRMATQGSALKRKNNHHSLAKPAGRALRWHIMASYTTTKSCDASIIYLQPPLRRTATSPSN